MSRVCDAWVDVSGGKQKMQHQRMRCEEKVLRLNITQLTGSTHCLWPVDADIYGWECVIANWIIIIIGGRGRIAEMG